MIKLLLLTALLMGCIVEPEPELEPIEITGVWCAEHREDLCLYVDYVKETGAYTDGTIILDGTVKGGDDIIFMTYKDDVLCIKVGEQFVPMKRKD